VDAERWDKALESFDAALALDRGMLEALCAASDAAVKQGRAKAEAEKRDVEEKDFDKAIVYGDRAVVCQPDAPHPHFVLAAAHEAAGWANAEHYDVAITEYQAAIDRLPIPGPDKVRALTAKAYVLIEKELFDQAIETAQKAIDIDKNCLAAYGHAAFALSAQGKPQDAINRFLKPGLKVDPKNARLNHDLGVAYWELKKPNDARKPLEDARTAEPNNGRYRHTLGELYYELKRYKEATTELLVATERLPREIEVWRSYGRACYSAKSWDECVRAYEKVCEMDDKTVKEHLYLAAVYADQKKDKEKAKQHVLKFRENGGSDPNLDDWMNQLLGTDPAAGGNKP
jgi:tetratricopeptide (TPR) repeat protein